MEKIPEAKKINQIAKEECPFSSKNEFYVHAGHLNSQEHFPPPFFFLT